MWPWEHAAVGYVLYSALLRSAGREPPSVSGVAAVVLGTQLPDVVDKPLSWWLGWVSTGSAVAHSVLIALPTCGLLAWVAVRRERGRLGLAFTVGYLSHLVADVLTLLRSGRPPSPDRILWPLVETEPYETEYGLSRGFVYLEQFLAGLDGMEPLVLSTYLLVPVGAVLVWALDGAPGLEALLRCCRAVASP